MDVFDCQEDELDWLQKYSLIRRSKVTPAERLCLLTLFAYAAKSWDKCYPSIKRVAYESLISESTAKRALGSLEAAGILIITPGYRNNSRVNNKYEVVIEKLPQLDSYKIKAKAKQVSVQNEPTPSVQNEPTPWVQNEPTPWVQNEPTPWVQNDLLINKSNKLLINKLDPLTNSLPLTAKAEFGGVLSNLENSDRSQPEAAIQTAHPVPEEESGGLVLATPSLEEVQAELPGREPFPALPDKEPAEELVRSQVGQTELPGQETIPHLLEKIRSPERPPQPPRADTTEITTPKTTAKRLDPYGPDRKDAPAVNWGIDNNLWQTKQELVAFRVAFIAYIPLVAKLNWINEPIQYVRSTIKKAIDGEDAAQATLIDLWNKYTFGVGIELPKAPWLSLGESDREWYKRWIETDTRWNWQREAIDNWADKALNHIDSKPCKEAWDIWLFDRQADTERLARWAKQKEEQDEAQRISDAFVPMTQAEVLHVKSRIQELKDRFAAKEARQKAERIAARKSGNEILGIGE